MKITIFELVSLHLVMDDDNDYCLRSFSLQWKVIYFLKSSTVNNLNRKHVVAFKFQNENPPNPWILSIVDGAKNMQESEKFIYGEGLKK